MPVAPSTPFRTSLYPWWRYHKTEKISKTCLRVTVSSKEREHYEPKRLKFAFGQRRNRYVTIQHRLGIRCVGYPAIRQHTQEGSWKSWNKFPKNYLFCCWLVLLVFSWLDNQQRTQWLPRILPRNKLASSCANDESPEFSTHSQFFEEKEADLVRAQSPGLSLPIPLTITDTRSAQSSTHWGSFNIPPPLIWLIC